MDERHANEFSIRSDTLLTIIHPTTACISVVGCPGSLCTTSVVRDPDANTISVKSGCYSGPVSCLNRQLKLCAQSFTLMMTTDGSSPISSQVRTAIPYKHETSDNSIDVNCWANTKR